jgi:hypothetical protein
MAAAPLARGPLGCRLDVGDGTPSVGQGQSGRTRFIQIAIPTSVLESVVRLAYRLYVRRSGSLLADAREIQLKGKRNPFWLKPSGLFHLRVADLRPLAGDSEVPLKRQNLNGARPGTGALAGLPI